MSAVAMPPESFIGLCQAVAAPYTNRRTPGYHATENQVLFFTAATGRHGRPAQRSGDAPNRAPVETIWRTQPTVAAHAVAAQLDGVSGAVVTGLKQKDPAEWSAFWAQLQLLQRKLAKRYNYQLDQAMQDEALEQSAAKIFRLVQSMPAGDMIDAAPEILHFTHQHLAQPGALYSFYKPFLHYTFVILHNEFRRSLKQLTVDLTRFRSLEEMLEVGAEPGLYEADFDEAEAETEALHQREQLKQLLLRLLAAIETLPRKRRLVAAYTLAGRPQFWLALNLVAQPAPDWYPAAEHFKTDGQIGTQLGMTDNSVRVNRSHAYQTIFIVAPELGHLFSTLSAVNF